jgi:hypothetical protein
MHYQPTKHRWGKSMASRTFTYRFEELPLIVDGPFEDTGVDGEAEVTYSTDGSWSIDAIGVQVSRPKTTEELQQTGLSGSRVRQIHWLDKAAPLYAMLLSRLEGDKRRSVDWEVADQIEQDREWIADHARDLRKHEAA